MKSIDRIIALISLLITSSLLLIPFFLHPDNRGLGTHEQLGLPPCPIQHFFHIPCPSCGLTTSFSLITHGKWISAFSIHPLGPILYLLGLVWIYISLIHLKNGSSIFNDLQNPLAIRIGKILIFFLLLQWLFKLLMIL